MKILDSRKLRKLAFMGIAGAAVLGAAASHSASAFTSANADTAIGAYLSAFYIQNGSNAVIQDSHNSNPGFWGFAEEIEGIEDANDRTGGAYKSQVAALLNGFSAANGTNWSGNGFNDDLTWAVIAYTRGYQATGNTTFRTIAKNNYDLMYARAWNTSTGGLYWTTDKTSYNSCIECPAAIAAYLLSQALGDSSYLTKSQNIFNWEKAHLYNANTGAVADAVDTSGVVGTWASTYNQGTFVGAANYLGDVANGNMAASYTMNCMGDFNTASGYRILPQYGSGGGNNSGLNSIGLRWFAKFMKDRNLQNTYQGWLQANANTAWNVRRTSDNLSWCQWQQQTPSGALYSWDCLSSLVALQVTPPGITPLRPYFNIVNQNSGKSLDLISGNTANGANVNQWTSDGNSGNQRWTLTPTEKGDHFMLFSWVDGKALSISNDSTGAGAQLVASDYTGGNPSQQWDLADAGNGWYNIKNVRSGMFLDVSFGSTADNATVWQWTSNNGGAGQKWRLQPWGTYYLRAECSGKYIGSVNSTNGSAVVQHSFEAQPWYQWGVNSRGDGWYSLQNLYAPGRAISSPGSSTTVGQSLSILDYNINNIGDQVARMVPRTNGTFGYFFKFDNLAWGLQFGSQADMAPLTQWTSNTGTAQQFRMERVQ